jgi:hypothetical protein
VKIARRVKALAACVRRIFAGNLLRSWMDRGTMSEEHELPPPEAIWLALGMVTWAIAAALAPKARARFLDALTRLTDEHSARQRIIALSSVTPKTGNLSRGVRLAVAWIRRILAQLRAARGV